MKRILYLANLNPNKFGSMEEHALFLSRELRARGHRCYLGFICEPVPEIRRMFDEAGAEILTAYCGDTPLVGNRASINLREMMALRRMVVENNIDLVHINFMAVTNPALLGVYCTRSKIVFTEHASGGAPVRGALKHLVSRCIHRVISRRISRYIGVSDFVRQRLKVTHHVPDSKTVTIYNGVNVERFFPRDRSQARKELDLPLDAPIICAVAMLIPEKGVQHMIEAVSLLRKEHNLTDVVVLVVGEGWYRPQLEALAKINGVEGNVRFLGRRSDVHTIIAASDTVVVPSVWEEAFGLIVAEALASQRPVIASRIGGIPELVADGRTGFLVSPGSAKEIACSVAKLMAIRGTSWIPANSSPSPDFSLRRAISQLCALYDEVVL